MPSSALIYSKCVNNGLWLRGSIQSYCKWDICTTYYKILSFWIHGALLLILYILLLFEIPIKVSKAYKSSLIECI